MRYVNNDGRGRLAQLTEAGLHRLEQAYPYALASVRRNVMKYLACLDLPAFAQADREHGLLEPGPALVLVLVRAPVVTSGAQRGAAVRSQRRRPQQRGSRLVDGLVDALVTQPHPRLRGEPQSQVAADLLRAPPLGQQPGDQLPLLAVCFDAPRVMAGPPRGRAAVGLERPVAARGGVAAQLTRDRQRCPAQPASDLPDAQARLAQISDLDPFVLRQEPRADLTHS